jgi:hypothetical protein
MWGPKAKRYVLRGLSFKTTPNALGSKRQVIAIDFRVLLALPSRIPLRETEVRGDTLMNTAHSISGCFCFSTSPVYCYYLQTRVVRGDWMGRSFGRDRKNRGPVSQQVWHDKDPSLLESPERRPKILQHFTGNNDLSMWVKNSWAGCKTVNSQ